MTQRNLLEEVAPHLNRIKSLGCDTLVDCTVWGLGNYSHFIDPGSKRIGINRSDQATHVEATSG